MLPRWASLWGPPLSPTLDGWHHDQQIHNWIMHFLLKYFVLPNAIFLGNENIIRDIVMKLKRIDNDVEHNRNLKEILVNSGESLSFFVNWATWEVEDMIMDMKVNPSYYKDFEKNALHAAEFLMNNVDLSNQYFLDRHQEFRKYSHKCIKELQRMKVEKLHREVTLLNLLKDDMTKVARDLSNRKMLKSLVKMNFKKSYPIYSAYLVIILDNVKEQYRLKEKTAARLAQLQGLDSHHLCVEKIMSFLEPEDMRMFLSCFEYESKSDEQKRT